MKDLDIGEVARRSGVPASALRFYEEKGLIATTGRRGLRRLFDPGVLERLALIALGRAAGFSLDEIARMFAPDGRPRIERRVLAAKAEELDRTIRELSAMRDGLRHAVACTAPSHMECRTFRRLMRAAATGTIGTARKAAMPRRSRLLRSPKKTNRIAKQPRVQRARRTHARSAVQRCSRRARGENGTAEVAET